MSSNTEDVEDIPVELKAVEATVLILIIAVSVIGNTSLWIVVLRTRVLRNVTNMFILGLSTADLLVATTNMPLTVYTILAGRWVLSDDACVVVGFINMLTLVTSVLSLCNISINRFFMVCRPAKFKNIYTRRNATLMIVATVTFATLLSSPPLLGWSEYVYTPTHSFCFANWVDHMAYAFFMIGCCFGIPFTVMSFCNIYIIKSVRESRRKVTGKSNYRSTISSTICSVNEADDSKIFDNTEDNLNSTKTSLSELKINVSRDNNEHAQYDDAQIGESHDKNKNHAPPIGEKENNNDHEIEDTDFIETVEIIEIDRTKYNPEETKTVRISGTTCNSSNTDVLSDDSSNESNASLIRENRKRNQAFTNRNSLRSKQNMNSYNLDDSKLEDKSAVKEPSLLHPGWRSSVRKSQESAINVDSNSVVSVSILKRKDNPQLDSSATQSPPKKDHSTRLRRREEIRLAVSLIVIVLLFVVCWLPYCISMLISIFYRGHVPRQFHMFTLLIGYANSGCNPIVYGVMNQRFKVGFKRLFCFWRTHRLSINSST